MLTLWHKRLSWHPTAATVQTNVRSDIAEATLKKCVPVAGELYEQRMFCA